MLSFWFQQQKQHYDWNWKKTIPTVLFVWSALRAISISQRKVLKVSHYFLSKKILPWSQRLSFNIIFFHLEICGTKRRVGRKRKPLVATVENLTFMLAQHLTAVKDVIFFWPITNGDLIYNLLTGPGGSVLRYSEINYFEAFAVFTSCQRNFQGLVFHS